MRTLIGYSMRSGSTLLQHVLGGHSRLQAYSDLSALPLLAGQLLGLRPLRGACIKPMDLLYLQERFDFYRRFDRFLWITRDPRASYLSTVESGYAYWFWRRGERESGIDVGLLRRWLRIYRHFFEHRERWHLVRYEDLVRDPEPTLRGILDYLELPYEQLYPFPRFKRLRGGDYKIVAHSNFTTRSAARHRRELGPEQDAVFTRHLGEAMQALGYLSAMPDEARARA
jgi:hypothetical protein